MSVIRVGLSSGEVVSYGSQMQTLKQSIEDEGGTVTAALVRKWVDGIAKEARCNRAAVQAVADKYLGLIREPRKRTG